MCPHLFQHEDPLVWLPYQRRLDEMFAPVPPIIQFLPREKRRVAVMLRDPERDIVFFFVRFQQVPAELHGATCNVEVMIDQVPGICLYSPAPEQFQQVLWVI